MLPIITRIDTERFQQDVRTYAGQAVFAMARAINQTLEQKQAQMRAHVASRLTIRNQKARKFFSDAIRFGRAERADVKQQPIAGRIVVLGGNQAARTAVFRRFGQMLLRQEEGGVARSNAVYLTQRRAFVPQGFKIPAPGLRTASKAMPKQFYPDAIGLSDAPLRRQDLNGFGFQYKGGRKKRRGFKKNTRYFFVKEGVGIFVRHQGGALNATGGPMRMSSASRGYADKRSEYDAIWFFRRQIRLPRRLQLEETFTSGLAERLRFNYERQLSEALRTAR